MGIPNAEASITYEFFECAVKTVCEFGQGSLLVKLDLKDAFHHIPVWPQDWHLQGCHWEGNFFFFSVLIFGTKSAPYIFNLFTEALHWIIQRHIPAALKHYLDNFLPIFWPSIGLHTANATVSWMQYLGKQLGLQFQESKTVCTCTCLKFLSIKLNSSEMEAHLPASKLSFLLQLLGSWESKCTCMLQELQELIRFLQFASQVIPSLHAFIQWLIDFSMLFMSPFTKHHVSAAASSNLTWWSIYANSWNGICLLQQSKRTFHVHMDTSGTKGIGGISGANWYSAWVP